MKFQSTHQILKPMRWKKDYVCSEWFCLVSILSGVKVQSTIIVSALVSQINLITNRKSNIANNDSDKQSK